MEREIQPTRVVVNASNKGQHWAKAWDSPEEVINIALGLIKESNLISLDDEPLEPRFLVKERWNARTFIVFDIFHDLYDPDTAHIDQKDLPVILVYLSEKKSVNLAVGGMGKVINDKIREIHNDTGLGSRPPFTVDHIDGKVPRYYNPRIPRR